MEPIESDIQRTQNLAWMILVISIIGILIVTWFALHKSITVPIEQVTKAIFDASSTKFTGKIKVKGDDEISKKIIFQLIAIVW